MDLFNFVILILYVYLVVCFGISMAISYTLSAIGQYSVLQVFLILTIVLNLIVALVTYMFTPTGTFSNLVSLLVLQEIVLIGIPLFFAFLIETRLYEFDSESIIPFIGVFGGLLSATIIGSILSVPASNDMYIGVIFISGLLLFIVPVVSVAVYTLFYRDAGVDFDDLPPYQDE